MLGEGRRAKIKNSAPRMGKLSELLKNSLRNASVVVIVAIFVGFIYGRYSLKQGVSVSKAVDVARASLWDEDFKPEGKQRHKRVVSLTPSLTETICALGAEEYLVGVTDNDDYPPSVKQLPSVGDMYPNLELIAAAAPDLIVYDEDFLPSGVTNRLAKLKGRKLPLHLSNLEDLAEVLTVLGQALDKQKEAIALKQQLADFLAFCRKKNERTSKQPVVFLAIWPNPIMTVGSSSPINSFITLAGGKNCYVDLKTAYPVVSLEDLLRRNPDIIIMNCEGAPDIKTMPGWSSLRAVRRGSVYYVPSSLLHRSTMRSLQGIEMLRRYCEVGYEGR